MSYLREMINETFHPKDVMESIQLILRISKKIEHHVSDMIKNTGLTMTQLTVLQMLLEKDGRNLRDFADFCNCSPATMTGVVDTLEKKDFIKRIHSSADRRNIMVVLTESGRMAIKSAPTFREIFKKCCAAVRDGKAREANKYLIHLDQNLIIEK